MKYVYTRPSGKKFEILEIQKGKVKSIIKYKEGKYIVEQLAFNKHISTME